MATLFPLFTGDYEIDQMVKIQNILGPPSEAAINYYKQNSMEENTQTSIDISIKGKGFEKYLAHCSDLFIDLLKKLLVYHPDERLSAKQALQHPYFQDITENKYYSQYFITSEKSNLLSKNILNESSMIKSVDDSQGNIQKIKNLNNNLEKMERFEKNGSNNKLSNINIMTMGSSNNIMKNINNSNSVNKNYNSNNNNSNLDLQHSQRNLKESIENENSLKKDKNKIKLPKIIKAKVNNVNTNMNSNNLMGTFKSNYAIIGGINFDLAKNLNNSNDFNNNIRYIKNESMSKKMNILKSKYVSPYSRKAIFNIPQKYGKQ
jgi:serine/threonine protein kinase